MGIIQILLGEPTVKFCEEAGKWIIARPGYALSNLAYIVVGIYLISTRKEKISKYFGIMTILIGILSMTYDITYTYVSQIFDLMGMYIFASFVLILNLKRLEPKIKNLNLILTLIVIVSLLLTIFFKSYSGDIVFGLLVLSILVTELSLNKKSIKYGSWTTALSLFLIGAFIWTLDFFGIWCDPTNLFNGRGIFHYMTAVGILYLSKFYEQFKD